MTDPAPLPAADVLGIPPDLPAGTPIATAPPGQAPPPETPDKAGQVWDRAFHEDPPRLNASGCWAKLRGNAARKAKGLPPTGSFSNRPFKPAEAAPAPAAPPAAPADPPPSASQPPPPELTGEAPPIRDGIPAPLDQLEARPLEAYAATATGLVDGAASVAQLTMGNAWILKADERRALVDASQRVLHHYQAPIVGPLLELVLVLLPIIGRRRQDPETRSAMRGLLDWFRSRGKPAPVVDPYRTMPAPGSSAPAAPAAPSVPEAYRDGPAAPVERRAVAWIP